MPQVLLKSVWASVLCSRALWQCDFMMKPGGCCCGSWKTENTKIVEEELMMDVRFWINIFT